ncbi:MAG TPA: hypothetical protein VE971_06275 [Candidatus Eisenbacteria bacterium]|nr:hypothetical protein [Candidatus Eisenbacteria bacterium]
MTKNDKLPSEEIQQLLKTVVDSFDTEDSFIRQRQLRQARLMKLLWAGFTNVWYSEVAHDWRIGNTLTDMQYDSAEFYEKPVNVFRAYLESIIAAMSLQIPSIDCAPDDVDNPLDTATAKAGNKIAELVYKHNDAPLLWLHALFLYCTEGLVAAYNYTDYDKKYGTISTDNYEDDEIEVTNQVCPVCKLELPDEELSRAEINEFQPDDEDTEVDNLLLTKGALCPNCLNIVHPELQTEKLIVPRMVGTTQEAKARQCVEAYGIMNVKIPYYARTIDEAPYLKYSYEVHYSQAIECYPHLRNKFGGNSKITPGQGMGTDYYDRYVRLPVQYMGDYPRDTVTIDKYWVRPSAFNVLATEEDVKKLKKKYPMGVMCAYVQKDLAAACHESLDDHWTITRNPLSDYIHYDPLGLLLTSIQEITNEIISLTLQTMEHGIPQTFADPNVLDFNAYRTTEATPGAIYPTKPSAGKSIGDAFYEVKTSNLSAEVLPFLEKSQELGQLASGALPSLFGGPQPNSSKTATQYTMSRSQALQRLQTTWKMFTFWWQDIFGKVIPQFIKTMQEDERFTKKEYNGQYINVFIRKSETEGKLGDIELEASENLPMTWAAIKDTLMQLMQGANPEVMAALMSPENIPVVKSTIGLHNFVIPGEDDRQKQYEEIKLLINSQPIPMPDGSMGPSVDVDPEVDNNALEADICRRWAVSEVGRQCKVENPSGYQNVLLHMKRHNDVQMAMMAMSQGDPTMGSGGPPNMPPGGPQGPTNSPNQAPNPAGDEKPARPMAAPLPRRNNGVTQ